MMQGFDRTLTNKDIMRELDIDKQQANTFLHIYGVRMGSQYVMSERELKLRRLNGDVMEFMKTLRKKGGNEKAT